MNASTLLQMINQQPFEPFEIRTTAGDCLAIGQASQIAAAPNTASCAVFSAGGDLRIISLDRIAVVRPTAPTVLVAVLPHRREIGYIILCWTFVLCMLPQIFYMTGITPTGPVPGLSMYQSVGCALVLTGIAYGCLRTTCWR